MRAAFAGIGECPRGACCRRRACLPGGENKIGCAMMKEQDQFKLLQDFLMKEEKIREFACEQDEKNIAQIAPAFGIGAVEFGELPGEGERRKKPGAHNVVFFLDDPDPEAEPEIWERETFGGTRIRFLIRPKKGMHWNESERYIAQKCIAGFAMIKKSVYLLDGFRYSVYHDPETGVRNLHYGITQISNLVRGGKIRDYAVFFMNINGTGEMNAQIGRNNGTLVMQLFLEKLGSILEEPEAVWRVGGDNLGAVVRREKIERFLEMIQGMYISYGSGEEEHYRISATAGICPGSDEFHKTPEILDYAMVCMNTAKYVRHTPYLFYDRQMIRMMENAKHVEMAFPEAIANEEFQVFYQPKVSLLSNEVIGAEALCRWIRDGEVVPPSEFIPVLERGRLVCDLDFYVLERACRDLRNWMDRGNAPVEISTNFSRMHLNNAYLSKQIVQTIDRYSIPHELVIVELTETTSTEHMKRMVELVYKLKDEGIRTSVDDFGVGYSSMSMLRDIPFSELKIDRSFLTYTTDTRDRSAVMMKHVISMATELGMRCIAEGVETPDQIRMLKEMECFRAQGFYFDKPLPREEFERRLAEKRYPYEPES